MAALPPGTAHQLHRHVAAEQAMIVIRGKGIHLRGTGHIPAGEWHGFANPFEETVNFANL